MTLDDKPKKRVLQSIDVDQFAERMREEEPLILEAAKKRRTRLIALVVISVFTVTVALVLVLHYLP
jgi:hypothetical protein